LRFFITLLLLLLAKNKLVKMDGPPQNAKSEVEIAAADAALRGAKGVVTGDLNTGLGAGLPTDANASTADPALQKVFSQPVGPGASNLEKIRAEAAAKQAAANSSSGVAQ
jgi:hypothetical protein